jgi:hypothetical protein
MIVLRPFISEENVRFAEPGEIEVALSVVVKISPGCSFYESVYV